MSLTPEREAFEKWRGICPRSSYNTEKYALRSDEDAWRAWQAAYALGAQRVEELEQQLNDGYAHVRDSDAYRKRKAERDADTLILEFRLASLEEKARALQEALEHCYVPMSRDVVNARRALRAELEKRNA
jgi:hypothetical protein